MSYIQTLPYPFHCWCVRFPSFRFNKLWYVFMLLHLYYTDKNNYNSFFRMRFDIPKLDCCSKNNKEFKYLIKQYWSTNGYHVGWPVTLIDGVQCDQRKSLRCCWRPWEGVSAFRPIVCLSVCFPTTRIMCLRARGSKSAYLFCYQCCFPFSYMYIHAVFLHPTKSSHKPSTLCLDVFITRWHLAA